jgi:pimeloyl-ACP methyl ester carboxylesterase
MNYRDVEFASEGATLRGRLYPAAGNKGRASVIVMALGFAATLDMNADRYAEAFAARGLAALLYDHYSFGGSGGEPRRIANAWVQARGYRDAVAFAAKQPEVTPNKIALWGHSFSGAEVLVLGGLLETIAAVSSLMPGCGDLPSPPDADGQLFEKMRVTFRNGTVWATPETSVGPAPVVSQDPSQNSLLPASAKGAYRWYSEVGGRPGSLWVNEATRAAPPAPVPFHPGIAAPHVRVPTQVIIAPDDEMGRANPAVTRLVCAMLPAPKDVVELEPGCGHFGHLWHPSPWFDRVSRLQGDFFAKHLLDAR